MDRSRLGVVAALGTAQTLAWGSSYYLPAILADPIARDLGISSNWFFAAFSASLVISGLLGPRVGRQIDRVGGRQVLCASNVLLAAGLALLGASTSVWMMSAAWILLGIGMGLGLYDAAFGALGRIYGSDARGAITGITLIAGFASTVGWPLSSLGLETIGWRETCYAWAAAHIVIGLPLNLLLPRTERVVQSEGPTVKAAHRDRPDHGAALVRVRRRLDGDVGDGGASAADRRDVRCDAGAGGVRWHDDRPGAGRRARS